MIVVRGLTNVHDSFVVPDPGFVVSAPSRYQIQVHREIPAYDVILVGFRAPSQ